MSLFWSQHPSPDIHESENGDSLKIIPLWSILLATIAFITIEYFLSLLPPSHHQFCPPILHQILRYSSGTALASYFVVVGYVSRDVRRRDMSAAFWVLIVMLMPGGIGPIVYFLLRDPILSHCPNCNEKHKLNAQFCSRCQFQIFPHCGQCHRGARANLMYIASGVGMISPKTINRPGFATMLINLSE